MMFSELQHIDYQDPAIKYSTFFIVMGMPLMYSITNGLLLGALVFVFINLVQGKYKQIGIAMGVLAAVALLVPLPLSTPNFNDKKKVQMLGRFLQD